MDRNSTMKIALGVLATLLLAYFYLSTDRTSPYNWDTHFKTESKDPYGCYLFYELLKSSRETGSFKELKGPVYSALADPGISGANYFFVGNKWYFDSDDMLALSEFVAKGNKAYIIANESPSALIEYTELILPLFFGSVRDSVVRMSLTTDYTNIEVDYSFQKDWQPKTYDWNYIDSISDEQVLPRGYFAAQHINFFELKYGSGSFFFHLSPLVFTNFHMRGGDQFAYADAVLGQLNPGDIYWDNFSRFPHGESENTQNPLSFILSQESLRWGWYILLSAAFIYLVFYTKRRQRTIPVTQTIENTSLGFVKTIGGMYYQQEAHLQIVRHQKQLFLTYIRTHYGIPTNKIDDAFLQKASLKSGVGKESIDYILKEAQRLELLVNITTKDLIAYNQLTEAFYGNCK